jgi:hypothetical protein
MYAARSCSVPEARCALARRVKATNCGARLACCPRFRELVLARSPEPASLSRSHPRSSFPQIQHGAYFHQLIESNQESFGPSIMATRSNFKRALPQGPPSFMSSLRTPEPAADSKAILPAGEKVFFPYRCIRTHNTRINQHHPRLPPRRRHVQIRSNVKTHARDGVRRYPLDTETKEHGLLE